MRRKRGGITASPSSGLVRADKRKDSKPSLAVPSPGKGQTGGLRERKKARLRQQIVETALHLFRQRGYENTRVDDIVHTLEISQPTFFPISPAKMRYCAKWDAARLRARQKA